MSTLIREIRLRKKLTQADLSALTGIPKPNISEIERGANTTVATLERIATALDVNVRDLFPATDCGESGESSN